MIEWIDTNSLGSYAASTINGANTRRYHGLLVASLNPPIERRVLLSRIDDVLFDQEKRYPLSQSIFQGQKPNLENALLLESFTVFPLPTWIYRVPNGTTLTKQLGLCHKWNILVIGYRLSENAGPIRLTLKPLLTNRDFHALTGGPWEWGHLIKPDGMVFQADSQTTIHFRWGTSLQAPVNFQSDPQWYWQYDYPRETERGLEHTENLYCPGTLLITLHSGETFSLAVSTDSLDAADCSLSALLKEKDVTHLKIPLSEGFIDPLLLRAAQQFIVERSATQSKTIIAGYHWFNDWGRDTMISLPGLTLYTGKFQDAESILGTFARYLKNGLLPNNFPDQADNEPGYNTLDASLWWFHAIYVYWQETAQPDFDQCRRYRFIESQYQALKNVLKHHFYGRHSGEALVQQNPDFLGFLDPLQVQLPVGRGTDGIGMDPDGLIAADNPQLTWMDAAEGSHAFTPRRGKPIEVNALWFHALSVMKELATYLLSQQEHGDSKNRSLYSEEILRYKKLSIIVKTAMQRYWNPTSRYLDDLLDTQDTTAASQIRPNAIFALSLPWRAFEPEVEQAVLETVTKQLLTPYGLRSLSPQDPQYAPYYPLGDSHARDSVYHQGTVWSWLIGPYLDAYLNVFGKTPETIRYAQTLLQPLQNHLAGRISEHSLSGAALGGISEIFDGNSPHYAKGCVNQAWSVAEVLRQYILLERYSVQFQSLLKTSRPTTVTACV